MSRATPEHVFVYGTLMPTATGDLGHDIRAKLSSVTRSLGPATLPGRLHDLGAYPAFVPPNAIGELVHGEVLELLEPAMTLPWLDEYEGVGRGAQAVGEYERVRLGATLATGRAIESWVYRYLRATAGLPLVPGGRWSPSPKFARKSSSPA